MTTKKRHFLKTDTARLVVATLSTYETKNALKGRLEVLETSDHTLILLNGVPVALCIDKTPFFTVRGAIELNPQRHLVTVDMGAVRFIRNRTAPISTVTRCRCGLSSIAPRTVKKGVLSMQRATGTPFRRISV